MNKLASELQFIFGRVVEWMRSREEGQAMVEYGLILALVAVVVAAALTPLGQTVSDLIENIITAL